jgi:hypothetical protein
MCADTCTGTTCSQTRFGHCAPDGRGIRTPCFRGSPAWPGGLARVVRRGRREGRVAWRKLVPRPPRAESLWFSGGTPTAARRPGADVPDVLGPRVCALW